MAYIIHNIKTNLFLKNPNIWTPSLRKATKFQSEEKVKNYMTHNFAFTFRDIPTTDVEFLDTNNLSAGLDDQNMPPILITAEEAAQELENLKIFVDSMLSVSPLFIELPKFYGKTVRDLDMETQDILHKIEFTNENVVNGFKRYKQLQDIRKRRREAKDALELSSLLLTSGLLSSLKTLKTEMEKLDEYMKKRKYDPRILTDLFECEEDDTEEQEDESA